MKKRKKPLQKRANTRELFEQCTRQLTDLNRRYAALFKFVNDPDTYSPGALNCEFITVTIERDMRTGETLNVRVPMKFSVSYKD